MRCCNRKDWVIELSGNLVIEKPDLADANSTSALTGMDVLQLPIYPVFPDPQISR
jgi:UTP-glucose-1-phosphate uridylyltransferase